MVLTETEMSSLKEDILRFKERLEMEKNHQQYGASLSVAPVTNPRSNRGSKMDPTSDTVNRNMISSCRYNYKLSSVDVYNNEEKRYESRLVYVNKEVDADLEEKIRQQVEEEFASDDEYVPERDTLVDECEDSYVTRPNDIFSTIRLDQLLRPITKPSDVVTIKSIKSIYKERYLDKLSNETISIIEKEQENVNLLNQIMNIFLLDDPEHIQADNLGLAEYNHHLDLDKEEEDEASMSHDLQELHPENDPFFMPPVYESDPQFNGIDQEEIDETRQLIQIALQRNEEFVRSLLQIRLGFLHADNYREQVHSWCKEMHENEVAESQKSTNNNND